MATEVFKNPYASDAFSDPYKSNVFSNPYAEVKSTGAIDTTDELQKLADAAGKQKDEHSVLRTVEKAGRALNYDIANISGIALGALRDDMDIWEGRRYGVMHNTGFSDVYKEIFGKPTTTAGKAAIGTAGFISDIVFSPITYLTMGYGGLLKAGSKVTKPGLALLTSVDKQFMSHAESLVAEGMSKGAAQKTAMWEAKRDLNSLTQKILAEASKTKTTKLGFGSERMSGEIANLLVQGAIDSKTSEQLMNLGAHIIDMGGIKFFGKTLISAEAIKNSPIGIAAAKIGDSETVRVLSDTLGKTFITDFKKNPKLLEIANRSSIVAKRAFKDITEQFDNLFKDLPDKDAIELFDEGIKKRTEEFDAEVKLRNQYIEDFNSKFPESSIASKEDAVKLYNNVDEQAVKQMTKVQENIDDIVEEGFKAREKKVIESGSYELGGKFTQLDELTTQVERFKQMFKGMLKTGERSSKKVVSTVGEDGLPLTKLDAEMSNSFIIRSQVEKKMEELDKWAARIEKARAFEKEAVAAATKKATEKGPAIKQVAQATADGDIAYLNTSEALTMFYKDIEKIQADLSEKTKLLTNIINSRKQARALTKNSRIEFANNKRLQDIADKLWNDKDSITAKLAKTAGIPEDEAYKFYIRPYYDEFVMIKKSVMGKNMSPYGKVNQDFKKMWMPNKRTDVRKNPAESFKKSAVEVANARIKSNGIKAVYKAFEKQTLGKTAQQLEEEGYVKWEKKILGENLSGYIPKVIKKDLDEFAEPRKSGIDELARVTGFDWATNMMKSWSTSLFPAFHVLNISSNQFQLMTKLGMDWMNPATSWNSLTMAGYTAFPKNGLFRKAFGMTDEAEKAFMAHTFKTKHGEVWSNKKLINEIKKHSDLLDNGTFGDMEQGLTEIASKNGVMKDVLEKNYVNAIRQMNPLSLNFRPLNIGREFGNWGETQAKLMAIQTGIVNGKTMKQSIKDAEDAIFNYSKLTTFEREYMKRLIPFYTFARKNFEYQLKSLLTNPGRVATQFKLFNNVNSSFGESMQTEKESGLPNFVLDKLGIAGGTNKFGQQEYITGFGLPIEEFLSRFSGEKGFIWNTVSNVMAQANPVIKYPSERALGIDMYKGRPIMEIDNGEPLKGIIDALGGPKTALGREFTELLGYREVPNQPRFINGVQQGTYTKYMANPYALHFFRNIPTARLQRTIQRGQEEAPQDYFLRSMLGTNTFTIDVQREEFFKDLAKKKELSRWLDRAGIISTKEIYFIPKEK